MSSVPAALHSLLNSSVRCRQVFTVHIDAESLQLPQGGADHQVTTALLILLGLGRLGVVRSHGQAPPPPGLLIFHFLSALRLLKAIGQLILTIKTHVNSALCHVIMLQTLPVVLP